MNRYTRLNFLISIIFLFSANSFAGDQYSDIVIFGDSFSDTGNFGALTGPLPPPYYKNRFSNGPIAIELLAKRLGLSVETAGETGTGNNFAVGGATASGDGRTDLSAQVALFLLSRGGSAPSDALYVIFIGGNDIRDARDVSSATEFKAGKAIVKNASSRVDQALTTLMGSGARKFLLINSPDIGASPETRAIAVLTSNPWLVEDARRLSRQFKRQLRRIAFYHKQTINQLNVAGSEGEIQIIEFDLFGFFNRLLRKAHRLGFTNNIDACINIVTEDFNAGCNLTTIDDYVFLDSIHPTARVHALAADAIYNTVKYSNHRYSTINKKHKQKYRLKTPGFGK